MAEHPGELSVDARYPLFQVEHDDSLRRALEKLVEKGGLHAQTRLGLFASAQLAQYQP
jgi:hypothetical protein